MIKDAINAIGEVKFELFDANGNKYFEKVEKNLVVSVGRAFIAARMKETGRPAEMSHMELGQGATPAAATDTAIQTPFGTPARVSLAVAGGTVNTNTVTYTATFGPGVGTGNVREAGIFNSNSGGTMLCRTVFGAIDKPAGDTLALSWQVSIVA